jgi:hypothetical protein
MRILAALSTCQSDRNGRKRRHPVESWIRRRKEMHIIRHGKQGSNRRMRAIPLAWTVRSP